jgi:hypothetical protein
MEIVRIGFENYYSQIMSENWIPWESDYNI